MVTIKLAPIEAVATRLRRSLFKDGLPFRPGRLKEVLDQIKREAPDKRIVVSFDMFDTLITRRWLRPTDLFVELGHQIVAERLTIGSAETFARERAGVEAHLRIGNTEEVTIEEIYRALAERMSWNDEQSNRARDLELACELDAARPVACHVSELTRLRAVGVDVVVISDTYFDRNFVLRLLDRCGIDIERDRVFVSSDLHAAKRTGRLYFHVMKQMGDAIKMIHIGDNVVSDVHFAAAAGIVPVHFSGARPTRYEYELDMVDGFPASMCSAISGSARAARLQGGSLDEHTRVVWNTAANVAAPLLFGFVLWTLVEARRLGITRLYFTARDGQILLRIAETILAKTGWSVRCGYLYGSRQAWHLPALHSLDSASLSWIFDGHSATSVKDHLARVELDPRQCSRVLGRYGFSSANWDRKIEPEQRARLRQAFGDPELQALILGRAAEFRDLARAYLSSAGLNESPAIVDIGWHGRLQSSLSKLMGSGSAGNARMLTGFYLGLVSRPDDPNVGRLFTFLNARDRVLPESRVNGSLLEVFCAADHGGVRNYRRTARGFMEPVLYSSTNDLALRWGLRAQQDAIIAFASSLADAVAASDKPIELWIALIRSASIRAMDLFVQTPSAKEAEVIGGFQHAQNQTHSGARDLAPLLPLSTRWLAAIVPRWIRYEGLWFEGSMRRINAPSALEAIPFALFAFRRDLVRRLLRALRAVPGS